MKYVKIFEVVIILVQIISAFVYNVYLFFTGSIDQAFKFSLLWVAANGLMSIAFDVRTLTMERLSKRNLRRPKFPTRDIEN